MKPFLLLFTSLLLLSSSCKKKTKDPIDQLPPETQTGVGTFACLVNGEVFTPKGNPLAGPIKTAQYQYVNGKQGFGISCNSSSSGISKAVGVQGDSITIAIGTFDLTTHYTNGKLSGYYAEFVSANINDYYTNEVKRGQLVVKKFDTINQIVSGTFWFDALDSTTNKVVQVREGRFDMKYVR